MMQSFDARYGINVDGVTYRIFDSNRTKLGISASEYLNRLMELDYSGEIVLEKPSTKYKRYVDLKQTRLYRNETLQPEPIKKE